MQINIKTNFPDITKQLAVLHSDVRTKSLTSAVNKTIEQAKTQMVREITSEFNVQAAYVRDRLSIKRATFKAGALGIEATLLGGGKRSANLIRFMERFVSLAQARKRAKAGDLAQLRFKIRKTGGMRMIKGAFIGNQGRTVFIRTTDKRLPIKALSTVDVPGMFNTKRINSKVVTAIKDKFPAIFEREAAYFINKFKP